MSLVVTSLPTYVDENKDKLLRAAVLGAKTAKMLTLQTGVKTKTALNLLNTTVVFGDGSGCGWSEAGTSAITQRTITAPVIKVNMSFCDKSLLNKSLQHAVRVAAGQAVLPFEEDFVNGVIESVDGELEKLLWQGDTTKTSGNLKWTDGLIKILKASDGVPTANKLTHTAITTPALAKAAIDAVVLAIPAEIMSKAVVFVGQDVYKMYVMALQAANLFHNAGDGLADFTTVYQGSPIRIEGVAGLNGTGEIVAGALDNLFFGTDLMNDAEVFDLWYSKDNQEFRLAVQFSAGVQVAFPSQVIISSNAS